jgi:uncharacterized membrane protein YfcA
MLGFNVRKEAFVATATAVGIIVDLARLPVYVATQHTVIRANWTAVVIATTGALAGTFFGVRLLRRVSETVFRYSVSALISALGAWMLWQALSR